LGSYIPCDQIQTSELELTGANLAHLAGALRGLGYTITRETEDGLSFRKGSRYGSYDRASGSLEMNGRYSSETELRAIKVSYSRQIVGYAAKQFGWKLSDEKASTKKNVALSMKARK
jgi:hypothetical protein